MKAKDTITINVGLNIDRDTAELCLRLIEMYANNNGYNIVVTERECGKTELDFIPKF